MAKQAVQPPEASVTNSKDEHTIGSGISGAIQESRQIACQQLLCTCTQHQSLARYGLISHRLKAKQAAQDCQMVSSRVHMSHVTAEAMPSTRQPLQTQKMNTTTMVSGISAAIQESRQIACNQLLCTCTQYQSLAVRGCLWPSMAKQAVQPPESFSDKLKR